MNGQWRYVVAALLLVFAWRGSALSIPWPPAPAVNVVIPKPEGVLLEWAAPLRPILPRMLVKDREYLASFYDAMSFVLLRDASRERPVIKTTGDFVVFHGGSLQLAVDRANVGKYPGLGEAIDLSIVNALGGDARTLNDTDRVKLTAVCSTLAYVFKVGTNE